jgi:hypothetical protein
MNFNSQGFFWQIVLNCEINNVEGLIWAYPGSTVHVLVLVLLSLAGRIWVCFLLISWLFILEKEGSIVVKVSDS